jgi:cation transporter-like permease
MPENTRVTIRKAPKFLSFFIVGAVLGGLIGLISWAVTAANQPADSASLIGYLLLLGIIFGAGLSLVAALLVDRLSRARSHTLEATKIVESAPKRRSKPAPKK